MENTRTSTKFQEIQEQYNSLSFIHSSLDDAPLTVDAFRVYGHLLRRSGVDGKAYPKTTSIAAHCFGNEGIADSTAKRRAIAATRELAEYNMIEIISRRKESGHQASNLYIVNAPCEWALPQSADDDTLQSADDDTLSNEKQSAEYDTPQSADNSTPIRYSTKREGSPSFNEEDTPREKEQISFSAKKASDPPLDIIENEEQEWSQGELGIVVEDEKPLTEWQKFVGALCWICFGHDKVGALTKEQRGQLLAEAKTIKDLDFGVDDLRVWYKNIWRTDWRYQKDSNARPDPSYVRTSIPRVKADTPEGFDSSSGASPNSKTARSLAAVDRVFDKMKQEGVSIYG